jgi:hypothetical protein
MVRANRIAAELRVSCESLSGALNDLEEPHGRQ